MDVERWNLLRATFEEASGVAGDARARLLDERCAGDARLRAELERMLSADPDALFLAAPASGAGLAPARRAPERLGDFRVLRCLGVGGMGEVYEAEQDEPRRRVALKVMRLGRTSQDAVRRFRFEAWREAGGR